MHLLEFWKLYVVDDLVKVFFLHVFQSKSLRIKFIFYLLLFHIDVNLFLLKIFVFVFNKIDKVDFFVSLFYDFGTQVLGDSHVFQLVLTTLFYDNFVILSAFSNIIHILLVLIKHVFRHQFICLFVPEHCNRFLLPNLLLFFGELSQFLVARFWRDIKKSIFYQLFLRQVIAELEILIIHFLKFIRLWRFFLDLFYFAVRVFYICV